jgi:hypothetical protein
MRIVVSMLLAAALSGCVSGMGLNLERESARSILPTPFPDSVTVSDVRHGFNESRWVATTRDGVYDCSLRDGEHQPICAKRDPTR